LVLVADAKEVEIEEPVLPVEHEEIVALAGDYRRQVTKWLMECSKSIETVAQEHAQKFELGIELAEKVNSQFVNALEIIQWYHALIEAKLRRAINGLNSSFEEEQADLSQSHANGCAKITMLFVKKSMRAWEQIRAEMVDQEDKILDHLAALSRLGGKIQKIFPRHEAFIRPGFDTFIL